MLVFAIAYLGSFHSLSNVDRNIFCCLRKMPVRAFQFLLSYLIPRKKNLQNLGLFYDDARLRLEELSHLSPRNAMREKNIFVSLKNNILPCTIKVYYSKLYILEYKNLRMAFTKAVDVCFAGNYLAQLELDVFIFFIRQESKK